MPTNVNSNKNTQNNSNHQSTKVVVNVQAPSAPKRRQRRKASGGGGGGGGGVPPVSVSSPTSVYYPHQATSIPDMTPTPVAFQSASTNRDVALTAMANDAQNQRQNAEFHNAYTQATVPSGSVGVQTDTFEPEAFPPTHSSVQEESAHVHNPQMEESERVHVHVEPSEEGDGGHTDRSGSSHSSVMERVQEIEARQQGHVPEERREGDGDAQHEEAQHDEAGPSGLHRGTIEHIIGLRSDEYEANRREIVDFAQRNSIPVPPNYRLVSLMKAIRRHYEHRQREEQQRLASRRHYVQNRQ